MELHSIYEDWRSYENQEFLLRPIKHADAEELLKVYSDKESQKIFNVDNFPNPCYFDTLEQMENEIKFYFHSYEGKAFVRWTIVYKKTNEIIGTIENFNRDSKDYFNKVGLLRMDIRSDYEKEEILYNLVRLILENAYEDFNCDTIATKAPMIAKERRKALEKSGFTASKEVIVGHQGQIYGDYFVRKREK